MTTECKLTLNTFAEKPVADKRDSVANSSVMSMGLLPAIENLLEQPLTELLTNIDTEIADSQEFDFHETDTEFTAQIELEDYRAEDIRVSITARVLSLNAEQKSEDGIKTFVRAFALPENADIDSALAHFKEGLLIISIPKLTESEARVIEIV